MAYSDPQSVTIGSAISLPRTSQGTNNGAFTSSDGTTGLVVSHAYGNRTRRTARINFAKIAADPLISAQNIKYSASVYMVIDVPITGFTVAEQVQIITGLTTWLTASTNANATKLAGGES
jgi:ribosomal protein L28